MVALLPILNCSGKTKQKGTALRRLIDLLCYLTMNEIIYDNTTFVQLHIRLGIASFLANPSSPPQTLMLEWAKKRGSKNVVYSTKWCPTRNEKKFDLVNFLTKPVNFCL